jgi:hypothetical protein
MPAGYSELFMEQGADFNASITLDDVGGVAFNLTTYTASSQMRKSYFSSNAAATFVVSTGNDPTLGVVTLSLSAANTANIAYGRYVYDVYLTGNTIGNTSRVRVLEGIINVSPQVTKLPGMM